ncbi:MAG: ABC transporter ATP-binding protein [Candidatus Shapirobacteria bacterium]
MSLDQNKKINYPIGLFFHDLWQYTHKFHRRLIFWYFLHIISALANLAIPLLLAKIIDNITLGNTNNIPFLISAIFIIGYSRIVGRNRIKLQVYKLAEACRLSSRQLWISTILKYDLKWHEKQNSGKKISVLARGSEQLKNLIQFVTKGGGGVDIFVNVFGVLITLMFLNQKYALLCLINIILYSVILIQQTKKLNQQRHQINRTSDQVMGKNFDYFSNMSLIKSLGIGQNINKVLFQKESKLTEKSIKYTTKEFNKWIYINTISQICNTIGIILIVNDIINNKISLGSFFVYTGYINRLQDGLSDVADWVNDLIEKYLGLFRVRQLLQSGTSITENGVKPFPNQLNMINIEELTFGYQINRPVLNNISITLYQGKKYGFVGSSGSGKSTLSKLLLKLYPCTKGHIYYNHTDISKINTHSLHQNIGVAPQDNEVFNLSFKENITISSPSQKFNLDLYNLAIKTAECQTILDKIKNNHQTHLGEKGIKLSGGERQRLGIARAIYKNTPIIIFDESTSALDSKTEAKILINLEKYFESKTIIWIAHRLSTLRFTDEIVLFDQGKIVETGSFKQLVTLKGYFYQLWQIQKKTKLK